MEMRLGMIAGPAVAVKDQEELAEHVKSGHASRD